MAEETLSSEVPAEGKPRRRRLFVKLLAVIAVIFLIAVVLLPYILPTSWAAGLAERGLQSGLKRPVKLGKVSWGWLSGVTVEDVVVSELEEFGGGEFLTISGLSLRVRLAELVWSLGNKVTVKSIVVRSPRVLIVRSRDGSYNFQNISRRPGKGNRTVVAASLAAAAAEPSLDISIDRIRIEKGAVKFRDLQTNRQLDLANINAVVDADFSKPRVTGSAEVSLDVVQAAEKGRVVLAAESFQVDRQLDAAAVAGMSASGTLEVEGVEIAEVLAAAAPDLGRDFVSGNASIALDYTIGENKLELKGRDGAVRGLVLGVRAVSSGPVEVGDVAVSFALAASQTKAERTLTLSDMQLKTAFADVTLSGPIREVGGTITAAVKASGSLDPSLFPAGLVELPPEFEAGGRALFTLDAEGDPAPRRFSLTVDASGVRARYPGSLDKKAGAAAKLKVAGEVTGPAGGVSFENVVVDFQTLVLDLSGGTLSGTAVVDVPARSAAWKGLLDFKGVDLSEYVEAREKVVCAGRVRHSGQLSMAGGDRRAGVASEAVFEGLSLDVPSRPGTEVALNGKAAFSSALAQTEDLVVDLGGSPLTVNAVIREPLTGPDGKITIRGAKADAADLEALSEALTAAFERGEETAGEEVPKPGEPPAEGGEAGVAREALANANVAVDLRVDTVLYEGYQGKNLVVDAGLVGGKLLVRNSRVDIFSGTIRHKSTIDLLAESVPAEGEVVIAALQTSEPVRKLLSKYLPGLDFSGTIGLNFSARGGLGGAWEKAAKGLTGGGEFEIADGVLALVELPAAVSALLPGDLDLKRQLFSHLKGNLKLAGGFVESDYVISKKGYDIYVEGKVSFDGEYTQNVGFIPGQLGRRVRLVKIENGKPSFETLSKDLLRAGAAAAIQEGLKGSEGGSREKEVLGIIGDILSGVGEGAEKEKPAEAPEE